MADIREGGCLCGAVRYQINLANEKTGNCHCEDCRHHTGATFSCYTSVPAGQFEWLTPPDGVAHASPKAIRRFCRSCGSPLSWEPVDGAETMGILTGTLDDSSGIKPVYEIFTKSRLSWMPPLAGVPQFETE